MMARQQPEQHGAHDLPVGAEQVRPSEGDAVTWMYAVVWGAAGVLIAFGLGISFTDGRQTATTAALGGVLAFVAVLSLRQWGSRTWLCLSLLAVGVYFFTLGTANWARLGYLAIVIGLLLSAAFDATPRTLRFAAGAALIVTAGLLLRIGLENTGDDGIDVFGAADHGAETVVSEAASPTLDGEVNIELGLVEWVVLAVLLGLAYRMLESASGARLVSPVTIEDTVALTEPQGAGHATAQTVAPLMRTWLAKAEIAGPTPVPGASTTQSIIDIASAEPLKSAGAVATAVAAAQRILFPPSGLVATPTYELRHPGPDHHGAHVLTVTLQDARTRRLRPAKTFTSDEPREAIGCASAFVAQQAMAHACTIPPWADWPEVSGDALGLYQKAKEASDETKKRVMLARALAAHPSSGVLKVDLGNALLLDGGSQALLVALRHYLEARLAYPRFILARYRLAATLAMLSDREVRRPNGVKVAAWCDDPEQGSLAHIHDLAHLLFHAKLVERSDVEKLSGPAADDDARAKVLVRAAGKEVKAARRRLRIWWLAWSALVRPREREANLRLLLSTDERRRVRLGVLTSVRLVEVRRLRIERPANAAKRVKRLTRWVEKTVARARGWTPVGATALYNAACFYALKAELPTPILSPDGNHRACAQRAQDQHRAVDLLNEIRRTFPSRVLTAAWLEHDPDLQSLQDVDAFVSLRERVGQDEGLSTAGHLLLPRYVLRQARLLPDNPDVPSQ
jgi:hypothetical protein